VLFTAELNRRLTAAGEHVQALCLHPGNVLTNVVQSLPAAIQSAYRAIMARVLLTPEQGAVLDEHGQCKADILVVCCLLRALSLLAACWQYSGALPGLSQATTNNSGRPHEHH
jgi:hypothetical protein